MKALATVLLLLSAIPLAANTMDHKGMGAAAADPNERLGTVSFAISCAATSQTPFNRGVALLHDFWYEEARDQFEQLVKSDPDCAMPHWGLAMSMFHQIWGRPDADTRKLAWAEMQKAQSLKAGTERERDYIAAMADFFHPGASEFPARIDAYSAAMGRLYARNPGDVDAGAFYALSLLAAKAPADESVAQERKAMAVLTPLFEKYPDNPGVVHYIIHACDNPTLASEGLAAADHYGEIAQSGPHAFHMPGHIYSRLGLWPKDIASQLGSIAASEAAEKRGASGLMDEPHSYDFVLYAYLQSGQDSRAKETLQGSQSLLVKVAAMPGMGAGRMAGMVPYYRSKLEIFYALEMRDWKSAAAMEPVAGSPPEVSTLVYWARAVAHGRLRQPRQAQADLKRFDHLMDEIKSGKHAYLAEGTQPKIARDEMLAWATFAEGKQDGALTHMRSAADLQDKVGQGEVDIPAREMLADMLLEFSLPRQALAEYKFALKLSPNRFNGLYNAGRAAEAAGDGAQAEFYYNALLKSAGYGRDSSRAEIAHAKGFAVSAKNATN